MSALCLKTGSGIWVHEEVPVLISGKKTKWFTLFKFEHGRFNYVKVWFFHRYHVSLVNAKLYQEGDKFRANIIEEVELNVVKGRWNHGPVYYEGEGLDIKLCC